MVIFITSIAGPRNLGLLSHMESLQPCSFNKRMKLTIVCTSSVVQACMLATPKVTLQLISWPATNECEVLMCCIQWAGMHLVYQLSNMPSRFLFSPKYSVIVSLSRFGSYAFFNSSFVAKQFYYCELVG